MNYLKDQKMNNFSPHMLKTFKECPRKYYYKYIEKISPPQKSTPFEKGKKIHALANYYLRGEDITKFEKILTHDENALWNKLKSNEYFQKTYVNSEYTLTCKIGDFWAGGRIDALMKDGNRHYILDYKTGSIPENPETDYQTMVYLLAVSEFLKNNNLTFVYIDLKNSLNHKIEFNEEQKNQYTNELIKICTQITDEKIFPENHKRCQFCEYNKFCYSSSAAG